MYVCVYVYPIPIPLVENFYNDFKLLSTKTYSKAKSFLKEKKKRIFVSIYLYVLAEWLRVLHCTHIFCSNIVLRISVYSARVCRYLYALRKDYKCSVA